MRDLQGAFVYTCSLVFLSSCNMGAQFVASKYVKSELIAANVGGTLTVTAADSATLAGAQIFVPAGALSTDTRIGIGYGSSSPAGTQAAGLSAELGPDGLHFNLPVKVTLPFALPTGTDIAQLEVFALESNGQSYLIGHDALLQTSGSMVTFQVNGFTEFQPGVAVPPPPDGGDGGNDGGDDGGMDGGDGGGMDGGDGGGMDGGDGGPDAGPTCTIGTQVYASRAVNPLDRTQCCNPVANASAWSPFFVKGSTFSLAGIADSLSADLNGDGWPDIVVSPNGEVYLFLNNGDGTFTSPSTAFYTGNGKTVKAVTLVDMNKDGHPDLIVALQSGATYQIGVLLNDGGGGFGAETDYTVSCYIQRFAFGDFNGDGWMDLLAAENSPCGVGIFLNDGLGDGSLGAETLYNPGFTFMAGIAVGDFNGDGQMDFAMNDGVDGGATSIYLNDGGATFGAPIVNTVTGFPWATAVGKLGNGTVDDLIVTGWSRNDSVVIGQDLGGLTSGTTYAPGSINAGIADFDGDGNQDFAIDDANGNLWFYFNQGGGAFFAPAELVTGPPIQGFSIADFNGDGAPDLAITTYSLTKPTLTIWYGGCP
jgi:hypothetical protein